VTKLEIKHRIFNGGERHFEILMDISENYIKTVLGVLVMWTGSNSFMTESNIEHTLVQ